MSRIIFVPVCEKCGHEFTELNFGINTRIKCPDCGEILNEVAIIKHDRMCHENKFGEYIATYSKDDYY